MMFVDKQLNIAGWVDGSRLDFKSETWNERKTFFWEIAIYVLTEYSFLSPEKVLSLLRKSVQIYDRMHPKTNLWLLTRKFA